MANKFWLGGTGNWDGTTNSSAHWGTASGGGTTPTNGPGVNDVAIFDGSSGGGTVTVTGNITVQSITCGAFTGTLDFSANNNNVTLSAAAGLNASGSGTRTLNLGNGTWALTATGSGTPINFNVTTNLTLNANSSVFSVSATSAATASKTLDLGGKTFSTISLLAGNGGTFSFMAGTIGTLNIAAPNYVAFPAGTVTITNAMSITGASASEIGLGCNTLTGTATISSANSHSFSWCSFRDMTFSGGGSPTAANSFDLGHNSGITITAPAAAGGVTSHIPALGRGLH